MQTPDDMDAVRTYMYVTGHLVLIVSSSCTPFENLTAPSRKITVKTELHHLLNKLPLSPGSSLIFVGRSSMGREIHDSIEDWTTQHGVTVMFFQIHAFEQSLSELMEKTLQKNRIDIYRKLFNFVVFCDGINNCLSHITKVSSRKDAECGQGTLLRHFSKWFFLNVGSPVLSEVHADLDNIAITVKWKPFCTKSTPRNGSIVYAHVCKDLLDSLGEYLNFTYELLEPPDKSWGELTEMWSGLLGMVARNDIDLSGIPYEITLKRSKSFAFPYILYQSECEIVHKKLSTNDNHWMLLVSVFKWEVYVCGLLTMAWCIGLYSLLERYGVGKDIKVGEIPACPPSTSDNIMTAVRVPLYQGSVHLPQSISGRIFLASWWLFCITIVAVYTGNLLAIISVAKETIPFSTMEELAENEAFKIIISKGSAHEDIYKYSNDSVSKKIWTKVMETRSANIGNSLDEARHYKMLLQSGYYAYITGSAIVDGLEKTVKNLRRMKCSSGPKYISLPFPLNSPLVELFSDKFIRLFDNGLLEAWARKWSSTKGKENVHRVSKLYVIDLQAVWLMCVSVIIVAFITLGVECFQNYREHSD